MLIVTLVIILFFSAQYEHDLRLFDMPWSLFYYSRHKHLGKVKWIWKKKSTLLFSKTELKLWMSHCHNFIFQPKQAEVIQVCKYTIITLLDDLNLNAFRDVWLRFLSFQISTKFTNGAYAMRLPIAAVFAIWTSGRFVK